MSGMTNPKGETELLQFAQIVEPLVERLRVAETFGSQIVFDQNGARLLRSALECMATALDRKYPARPQTGRER